MKQIFQSKTARIILACAAGVIYTLALPHMLPVDDTLWFANSILPLFIFIAFSVYFNSMWMREKTGKRECVFASILSLFLSSCLIFGKFAVVQAEIPYNDYKIYLLVLLAAYPLYLLIAYSWRLIDGIAALPMQAKPSVLDRLFNSRYLCVIIAASLLLLWLPTWLANWPGTFRGDEIVQLAQFEKKSISTDFPVLHTLFVGFVVSSVKVITGSYNAGIAVCTGMQMIILSLLFAYVVKVLRDMGAPRLTLILSWLWYAFHPVVRWFSKDTVRDTLFSATMLLFALTLAQMLLQKNCAANKKKSALLTASGFLCVGMRNAGFYLIVAVCAAALLLILLIKNPSFHAKAKGCTTCALAAIIALSFLWKGPICGSFVSEGSLKSENLSVPIQQVARAAYQKWYEFSGEDTSRFDTIFSHSRLYTDYDYDIADTYKWHFNRTEFDGDKKGYIKWWLSLGERYPDIYLDAFFQHTCKAWYPDSRLNSYCTLPVRVFDTDVMYYGMGTSAPGVVDSLLPQLYSFEEKLVTTVSFSRIPLVSLLFSPAFMMYIVLYCLFYGFSRRRFALSVPALICMLYFVGCLFTPTVVLRYYLGLFFFVPVSVSLLFCRKVSEASTETKSVQE